MNLSAAIKYILLILVLFLPGCYKTYNQRLLPVKSNVAEGDYEKALSSLKKSGLSKQSKNRLLYHLEAGLLYHLAGEYEQSNHFLENAEWISDELYTKSITGEAASLVTSDMMLPYRGEYYEYLFTNYYKLLNYLYLGNLEDALVEVRRINHKLSIFKREDAFMHYITAILYEYNFQDADAFIEYKKAHASYSSTYSRHYGVEYPQQLSRESRWSRGATDRPYSLWKRGLYLLRPRCVPRRQFRRNIKKSIKRDFRTLIILQWLSHPMRHWRILLRVPHLISMAVPTAWIWSRI